VELHVPRENFVVHPGTAKPCMKRSALALPLAAALAACGTAGTGTGGGADPVVTPSTTDVSMAANGGGFNSNGTTNATLRSFADNGAVVQRVPRTPQQVWPAVRDAYTQAEIPVATADSARGVVASPRFEASRTLAGQRLSAYFSCGDTPMAIPIADAYRLAISAQSTVRAWEGGSRVDTRVSATAVNPGTGASVDCTSTGALEARLNGAVLTRLGVR
jgi:hypothetical protein